MIARMTMAVLVLAAIVPHGTQGWTREATVGNGDCDEYLRRSEECTASLDEVSRKAASDALRAQRAAMLQTMGGRGGTAALAPMCHRLLETLSSKPGCK